MTRNLPVDRGPRLRVEHALALITYAELRAVMLAWAGVPAREPRELARAVALNLLADTASVASSSVELQARAIGIVRSQTAATLAQAGARLGPFPWDRIIARGQVGSLEGLERIFHDAGELAAKHRAHDVRALAAAVSLADALHLRAADHR